MNITVKKSLGQHFLTNTDIVASIADAAELSSKDITLEIGPGKGILTSELLKRCETVIAVEKDKELIPFLTEKFKKEIKEGKLNLREEDILDFSPSEHIPKEKKYKLVANIPYYITGLIMRKFLEADKQPEKMVLLVQKEVAERAVAKNKKESLLSLSIKAYSEPKYIKTVKAGAFTPPPKVDSAILTIGDISRKAFDSKEEEKGFFEMLHAGFAHKRKLLVRNLEAVWGKETIQKKFKVTKTPENARAEDLTLSEWLLLNKS